MHYTPHNFHTFKLLIFLNIKRIIHIFQDYDAQDLLEFEETILQGVEYSSEGKISRKQLTMILLALAKHHQEEEPATP